MKQIKVYHYDAFSAVPGKGNPAGVVLHADDLHESDMQRIAYAVGFNETVFVLQSAKADLRLRYYTPGHEINLCGHATVSALFCLQSRGLLGERQSIHIETNVGILPIRFHMIAGNLHIEMKQDGPRFMPFGGDAQALAEAIGLQAADIDASMPIVYGSTGTWTVLVPIARLASFERMRPQQSAFPDILKEVPRASMHARHFSSPYSGTTEDPVTGTASGVMGAYYLTYMDTESQACEFLVEQGHEIGREGSVLVKAARREQGMDIRITGTARFVREWTVE